MDARATAPGPGRRRRVTATLLLAGSGLVGSGVLSAWQATSDVSTGALTADSGDVQVLDANGSTFSSAVPDLLPGDFFHRYVDLRNPGSASAPFTGQITATGDLAASLSATVEACATAWGADGTCAAPVLVAAEQALSSPMAISYGSIAPGVAGTKHVRYRFTFSSSAASSLMGKAGSITASVSSTLIGGRDRTSP